MRYGLVVMHGLRCSPSLLGWTRLLDEWVVGLTDFNRAYADEPTCWEDPERTRSTLISAARRVVSFALRETDGDPVATDPDGFLSFELQGLRYVVATDQHSPSSTEGLETTVRERLDEVADRAANRAEPGTIGVGALFVTPRLAALEGVDDRFQQAEPFLRIARDVPSSGCAYSFPAAHELRRFHYTNDVRPGAVLTVLSRLGPGSIST